MHASKSTADPPARHRIRAGVVVSVALHLLVAAIVAFTADDLSPNPNEAPKKPLPFEAIAWSEVVDLVEPNIPPGHSDQQPDLSNPVLELPQNASPLPPAPESQSNTENAKDTEATEGTGKVGRETFHTPSNPSNPPAKPSIPKDSPNKDDLNPNQASTVKEGESSPRDAKTSPSLLTLRRPTSGASNGARESNAPAPRFGTLSHANADARALAVENPSTVSHSTEGASMGPPVAPPREDRESIEIGGYRFLKADDGSLEYFDPVGDFNAVLLPDGSVEFESRTAAPVGACALGVCVVAGAVRKPGERRRERLNRVRIRFAPVPLGVMMRFDSTRGIPIGQLRLLRQTLEYRNQLILEAEKQKLLRALAQETHTLKRIWNEHADDRSVARRIILARATDLVLIANVHANSEISAEIRELEQARLRGAQATCDRILRFARDHLAPKIPDGFTNAELAALQQQCNPDQR